LRVFGVALQQLLLVVNRLGARLLLCGAQLVALGLELLGQAIDLVAQNLQLLALGIVLLLQVGEVALALVGLGHGHLKGDDGNLGWTGRRSGGGGSSRSLGGGAQDKARGQSSDECKRALHADVKLLRNSCGPASVSARTRACAS
jgi:uncharacterized membrane protein YgcG